VKPAEIPKTWDEPIAGLRPRFEYQYIFAAKKTYSILDGFDEDVPPANGTSRSHVAGQLLWSQDAA